MLDRSKAPSKGKIEFAGLPQLQTTSLNSGVKLHYLNAGALPVVKIELVFQSGGWYESKKSISWFAAKMLAEGTNSKSAKQISEGFESLGAFFQIEPGFDEVSIGIYGLKKNFGEVLRLLNEVLHEAAYPVRELEILKSNRADQIRLNDEKGNMYATKMLRKAIYGEQYPYGKILNAEDIDEINIDQVKDFYKTSLFQGAEVYLAGMIDNTLVEEVKQILCIEFIEPAQITNESAFLPRGPVYVERKGSMQSSIRLAWGIPEKSHQDYFDYLITNNLLGGYFGSRLMKNIREDKGYTYGINASPIHLKRSSFGLIATDIKAENTQDTFDEIFKEIKRLGDEPIAKEEIETLTNYMAGSFLSSLNTPFSVMDQYKSLFMHGLDVSYFEKYFESLNTITSERIQMMARKYFNPKDAYQVTVGLK